MARFRMPILDGWFNPACPAGKLTGLEQKFKSCIKIGRFVPLATAARTWWT